MTITISEQSNGIRPSLIESLDAKQVVLCFAIDVGTGLLEQAVKWNCSYGHTYCHSSSHFYHNKPRDLLA